MPTHEPLIYEYRGQILDNVHQGYVSIVDESSNVLFHIGSPDEVVFYRSASKPIQALPVIVRRLDEKYGLTEEEQLFFLLLMPANHFMWRHWNPSLKNAVSVRICW